LALLFSGDATGVRLQQSDPRLRLAYDLYNQGFAQGMTNPRNETNASPGEVRLEADVRRALAGIGWPESKTGGAMMSSACHQATTLPDGHARSINWRAMVKAQQWPTGTILSEESTEMLTIVLMVVAGFVGYFIGREEAVVSRRRAKEKEIDWQLRFMREIEQERARRAKK